MGVGGRLCPRGDQGSGPAGQTLYFWGSRAPLACSSSCRAKAVAPAGGPCEPLPGEEGFRTCTCLAPEGATGPAPPTPLKELSGKRWVGPQLCSAWGRLETGRWPGLAEGPPAPSSSCLDPCGSPGSWPTASLLPFLMAVKGMAPWGSPVPPHPPWGLPFLTPRLPWEAQGLFSPPYDVRGRFRGLENSAPY